MDEIQPNSWSVQTALAKVATVLGSIPFPASSSTVKSAADEAILKKVL
jgi:hypothetical protein